MKFILIVTFTFLFLVVDAQKHFLTLEAGIGNSLEVRRTSRQSHGIISLSSETHKIREPLFGFGVNYCYYGELLFLKSAFQYRNSNVITSYTTQYDYDFFQMTQYIGITNIINNKIFVSPTLGIGYAMNGTYKFLIPSIGLNIRKGKIGVHYNYEYIRPIPFFWANYCSDNECHLSFSQLNFSYLIGFKKKE